MIHLSKRKARPSVSEEHKPEGLFLGPHVNGELEPARFQMLTQCLGEIFSAGVTDTCQWF